jgi:uncharacterized protein with beta-barrel porin domain
MKTLRKFIVLIVSLSILSPGYARQTVVADPAPMDVDGGLNGVDITGAHTLLVGVLSGSRLDIYTNNPSPYVGVTAVGSPVSNDAGIVQFNVDSNVDGDMGATTTHVLHRIDISDGTNVSFLGSVYSTTMGVGAGTVNFNGGASATNTIAPVFTGDGVINVSANSIVTGALTTNTDNTGTLALGSGSQWTGAVGGPGAVAGLRSINVTGGSNLAGVTAGITGAVYTNALSLLTNTLNVTGALTLASNAVINTTLASTALYGHIVAAGGPVTVGTAAQVTVTVPSNVFIPVGTKFDIIQPQNGGTIGAGATATDPTNPLYLFSVVSGAPGLLEINTLATPLESAGTSPNSPPLPALPALLATPLTADLGLVLASINSMSDTAEITQAVTQLGPTAPSLNAPLETYRTGRQFQDLYLSRLNVCSDSGPLNQDKTNCQDKAGRGGWWLNGFGDKALQHDRDGIEGYRSSAAGTMLAYDVPLSLQTRAGVGVGYARTMLNGNSYDGRTDINTYQAMAYAGHDAGPLFVNGSATFGWNEYRGTRPIIFTGVNRTANADYDGQAYTAMANTGYHVALPAKFTVTPLASLQYSRVNVKGYTETDAGDVSLQVASESYNFLESGLGTKAERTFDVNGMALVPEVHVQWMHNLLNPTMAQTASYTAPGGPSFRTQGLNVDRDTYRVGTAVNLLSCNCSRTKLSAEAGYDYSWTMSGYSAHLVSLRFTDRF